MELYCIPVDDKVLIYRPLLHLAFVGNRAMADCCRALAEDPEAYRQLPAEAVTFLQNVGFLQPDPPPPAGPHCGDGQTAATFLLTNRCNLRCIYCYAAGGESAPQDLSVEQAKLVIDQVCANAQAAHKPSFGVDLHGGGEPMQAWSTLQAIVAYARDMPLPCQVSLTSNAVWADAQRAWVIANVDSVSISFDGAQATQDAQRPLASGKSSFALAMETIHALDEARRPYGIRMTAMPPYYPRLVEDVRFLCEATQCRALQVEPVLNSRRQAFEALSLDEAEDFVLAFSEAFEVATAAGRHLVYAAARPGTVCSHFCGGPYGSIILRPDGDLTACYEVTDRTHALAELATLGRLDGEGVQWDDAARARLWAHLDQRRAACRDCFCYWHCAGDCFARAWAYRDEPDPTGTPRCHINRQLTLQLLLWYIMSSEDGAWRGLPTPTPAEALLQRY